MKNQVVTVNEAKPKTQIITLDEVHMSTRKTWGTFKPYTRVFKNKKAYSRKDKSWKNF